MVPDDEVEDFSLLPLDDPDQLADDLLHLPGDVGHLRLRIVSGEKEVERFRAVVDSFGRFPQFGGELLHSLMGEFHGELLAKQPLYPFFPARKFNHFAHAIILRLPGNPSQDGGRSRGMDAGGGAGYHGVPPGTEGSAGRGLEGESGGDSPGKGRIDENAARYLSGRGRLVRPQPVGASPPGDRHLTFRPMRSPRAGEKGRGEKERDG